MLWSKSNRSEAGGKADTYLRELLRISQDGWNHREKLRIFEFIATIQAWSDSGDPRAIYKTDEVLYLLLQQFQQTGNNALHPNARLFEAVLKVLASSNIKDKAKYADRAVSLMKEYGVKPGVGIIRYLKICYSERIEERRKSQQSIERNY